MTSVVATTPAYDHTELRHVLRAGAQLGVLQSATVAAFAYASRLLSGPVELGVLTLILIVGVAATISLPGLWTKAKHIEGIAGAAGIGLFATVVFLLVDVSVFQPLGIYSNRWLAIGGGSNWWYHPVWWMVGTFMPWMGAMILASQTVKSGAPNPLMLVVGTLGLAAVVMAVAVVAHVPGAAFGVGTYGVSVLPALAIFATISAVWASRQ